MSTTKDLTGRVAVITGASSGMGHATARLLASRGAKVALLARRESALKELAAAAKSSLRTIDIFARFGGEEFIVLYPSTPLEGARAVTDRRTLTGRRAVAGHLARTVAEPVALGL